MSLSINTKQNLIYLIFIVVTSFFSFTLYRYVNKDWVIFREAETSFKAKDFNKAISLYQKIIENGFPLHKLDVNLATAYVATERFKEAIPLYRHHLQNDPSDTNIRLALARALSWAGDLKGSEEEYKKILELKK